MNQVVLLCFVGCILPQVFGAVLPVPRPNFCQGRAHGHWADPDDCGRFYQCDERGKTFLKACPSGLKFRVETSACDWPRNVNCDRAKLSVKEFCIGELDGQYKHPSECSQFIDCVANITYIRDCPSGLHYNTKTCRCDWPANINFTITPIMTKGDTRCLIAHPSSSPIPVPRPNFCQNRGPGYYADPDQCSRFYQCDDFGKTFLHACAAGLNWNVCGNTCDWPKNVECDRSKLSVLEFCIGELDGDYKHPSDCEKFIKCSGQKTYVESCQAGLQYNYKICACDFPRNVKCKVTPFFTIGDTRCGM